MARTYFQHLPTEPGDYTLDGGHYFGRPTIYFLTVTADGDIVLTQCVTTETLYPNLTGEEGVLAIQAADVSYRYDQIPLRLYLPDGTYTASDIAPVLRELVDRHGFAFAVDRSRPEWRNRRWY